jgi:predicted  nucleic acid-binding Zn-ribbon protein
MNSSKHPKSFRISLIIAILAGVAVCGLNVIKVKEKLHQLQSGLREQTLARQRAETDLTSTRRELATTVSALNQTKATLQSVTAEKETALASAASKRKRAEQLENDLTTARRESDDARAELARYRAAGMEPDQIVRTTEQLRKLQKELGIAHAGNKVLREQVKDLTGRLPHEGWVVKLPAGLDGKVLVSDPRWQFIVLDAGEKQGVLERGELLVNRDGKLVAKVVVTRVEADRSVATVMSGWRLGEIAEGDRVIPAHPGS